MGNGDDARAGAISTGRGRPSAVHRYTAVAERSGAWWAITVPDLPGVFTQAKRLDGPTGAEAMAREALALMLGIPTDQVKVELQTRLPQELQHQLEAAQLLRAQAEQAADAAARAVADVARRLTDAGLSVRDASVVMGLSPQRISQLAPRAPARDSTEGTIRVRRTA